mmetsp:Transcript_41742/g.109957  ORF Transcript_41742/g.109957 Transcript_41742/m.109957 type:complete len:222 (-) Transcript_41742:107-772(-)
MGELRRQRLLLLQNLPQHPQRGGGSGGSIHTSVCVVPLPRECVGQIVVGELTGKGLLLLRRCILQPHFAHRVLVLRRHPSQFVLLISLLRNGLCFFISPRPLLLLLLIQTQFHLTVQTGTRELHQLVQHLLPCQDQVKYHHLPNPGLAFLVQPLRDLLAVPSTHERRRLARDLGNNVRIGRGQFKVHGHFQVHSEIGQGGSTHHCKPERLVAQKRKRIRKH